MTSEQFNRLSAMCSLDGVCYSLINTIDQVSYALPVEIAKDAGVLQAALQSFRRITTEYVIAHKDTYIDKKESNNENGTI